MGKHRGVFLIVGALAVSALVCLALIRWDNKYTQPAAQPINGLLILSEDELSHAPVRYLVREWRFYDGVLLSPQDAQPEYLRYLDIGARADLSGGKGSYALTISLPENEAVYALEMPEIYTAYRLYVNGACILELGDPEKHVSRVGSRIVTFSAAGTAELLVAVSDDAGIYSGMTSPPAFGTVQAVSATRDFRLIFHGAGALIGILVMALSLAFGLRGDQRRGLLALALALCFTVAVGQPLFSALFERGYQPWASVEMLCRYGLLALAVGLQCSLYDLWDWRGAAFVAPCALGVTAAVVRTAGAAWWPPAVGLAFSALSAGLKLYTAVCLIGLSLWALRKEKRFSALLLCASVTFGTCLVFDRLYPLYEPIFGGWLMEIGGVLLSAALAAALSADATDAYRFRLVYAEERQLMEREISLQKEHYQQLSQQIEQARRNMHDVRHHMRTLRELAQQRHTQDILNYLDAYEPRIAGQVITTFSNHPIADAVLCHYAAEAAALDAAYDVRFSVPPNLPLPDDELCILLGNLIENAIEALRRQSAGVRRLYLRGSVERDWLGIVVENTFDGVVKREQGAFLSTKRNGRGVGLQSVETIARQYGGLSSMSAEGTLFRASVMIPLYAAEQQDAQHQRSHAGTPSEDATAASRHI